MYQAFTHFPVTRIAGIDYGSKLAGTTVIAFVNESSEIVFAASDKNKDADRFIIEWANNYQPTHIFLDAPLSLPSVYQNFDGYNDYFYRAADRAVQAMSPLFLGGLTARAMQLKNNLQKIEVEVTEVYPSHLAKTLNLDKQLYKKQKEYISALIPLLFDALSAFVSLSSYHPMNLSTLTWHHFDALLALCSGFRYLNNQHLTFGNSEEGLIIV